MDNINEQIEEKKKEIYKLQEEIMELEKSNSQFYIIKETVGNGNYWDEYFAPVGFLTGDRVKAKVEELYNTGEYYDVEYFAVDKDQYQTYCKAAKLREARKYLNMSKIDDEFDEQLRKFKILLEETYESILNNLETITYPSFQHVIDAKSL